MCERRGGKPHSAAASLIRTSDRALAHSRKRTPAAMPLHAPGYAMRQLLLVSLGCAHCKVGCPRLAPHRASPAASPPRTLCRCSPWRICSAGTVHAPIGSTRRGRCSGPGRRRAGAPSDCRASCCCPTAPCPLGGPDRSRRRPASPAAAAAAEEEEEEGRGQAGR